MRARLETTAERKLSACPHWRLVARDSEGVAVFEEPYADRAAACAALGMLDLYERVPVGGSARVLPPTARLGGGVYFVLRDDQVKIGVTKDARARLKTLQTASASPLLLLALVIGGRDEEAAFHKRFASLRVSGEWFRFEGELAEYLRIIARPEVYRARPPVSVRVARPGVVEVRRAVGGAS